MQKKIWVLFTSLILISGSVFADNKEYDITEIVAMAEKESHVIRESEENRASAQMSVKSAVADFLPKAKAQYQYTSLKDTPYRNMDLSFVGIPQRVELASANTTMVNWNVSLVQPLFTGFALTTKHKMAKLDVAMKTEEKRQSVLDVRKKAKEACYNALLAEKMLRVAEDAVKSYQAHVTDAEKFYGQGIIPYNDLLKFQVALANATQNMEKARAGVEISRTQINLLLNRDMNETLHIRDINPSGFLQKMDLDEYVMSAMKQRPVLKIVDMGIQNLANAVKLTESAYYPKVALIGRYQQTGDNVEATNNEFDNQHNTSVTVNAEWTFFEWGKTRAESAKINHKKRGLMSKLQEIKNNVKLEIKNNYLNLGVSSKNVETAKKALDQARENLRITDIQYSQQVATSTEVLDARTFLTQADLNYYRAVYGYMINKASLERSAGM